MTRIAHQARKLCDSAPHTNPKRKRGQVFCSASLARFDVAHFATAAERPTEFSRGRQPAVGIADAPKPR
ncbi:MAG: hypothetical protein ACREHD_32605, partial [Pirellulales bacterium]